MYAQFQTGFGLFTKFNGLMIQIKTLKMIKKLILSSRLKNNRKIVPGCLQLEVRTISDRRTDVCYLKSDSKEILSNWNALGSESETKSQYSACSTGATGRGGKSTVIKMFDTII